MVFHCIIIPKFIYHICCWATTKNAVMNILVHDFWWIYIFLLCIYMRAKLLVIGYVKFQFSQIPKKIYFKVISYTVLVHGKIAAENCSRAYYSFLFVISHVFFSCRSRTISSHSLRICPQPPKRSQNHNSLVHSRHHGGWGWARSPHLRAGKPRVLWEMADPQTLEAHCIGPPHPYFAQGCGDLLAYQGPVWSLFSLLLSPFPDPTPSIYIDF